MILKIRSILHLKSGQRLDGVWATDEDAKNDPAIPAGTTMEDIFERMTNSLKEVVGNLSYMSVETERGSFFVPGDNIAFVELEKWTQADEDFERERMEADV